MASQAKRRLLTGGLVAVVLGLAVLEYLLNVADLRGFIVSVVNGTAGAAIAVLVLYGVAKPRIEIHSQVLCEPARTPPTDDQIRELRRVVGDVRVPGVYPGFRYNVKFRSLGPFRLINAHVTAYIYFPRHPGQGGITTSIPIELSRADPPAAPLARVRAWQTPRLRVEEIEWAMHVGQENWPRHPLDLRRTLEQLDGVLRVEVSSTSRIFQILGTQDAVFHFEQIDEQPPQY